MLTLSSLLQVAADKQAGAEPGWMHGTIGGNSGWFPQAYVELVSEAAPADVTPTPAEIIEPQAASPPAVTEEPMENSFEADFNQ